MGAVEDELLEHAKRRVGQLLAGKYRVERVLGVGGMAAVYAATHRNGHRVAVKLLHPELSIRSDLRQRFIREGHAANAVDHAGVVAVTDDDVTEDGAAFLVMELLSGSSVEELWEVHSHRLPLVMVLTITRDLCEVLAAAHRAGVVHRDIKPANLFLTSEGRLKVLDFGIARVRDEVGPRATQTGTVLGTPAFMAPEQAGGLTNEVDAITDLWAVGATMFTLLSGRSVHDGKTAQHITVLAATKPAPSLATVMPDAPSEIVSLVDRALQFDKVHRWRSADAMRDAINAVTATLSAAQAGLSDTMLAAQPAIMERTGTLLSQQPSPALVGSSTAQPVSSTSVTTIRHRRSAVLNDWWATAHARVLALLFGGANKDVVSSGAPTRKRWRVSRGNWPLVALLGIGLIVLTLVFDRPLTKVGPATAPISSDTREATAPTLGGPITPDDASSQVASSVVAAPTVLASEIPAPTPTLPTSIKSAKTRPRPVASQPQPLNCTPPFVVQDGIMIHKKGCP